MGWLQRIEQQELEFKVQTADGKEEYMRAHSRDEAMEQWRKGL